MKKDVIYIDVEDDITAIIGKIKQSEAKIVALVPPKRIGAIQSIVNLKLALRTAENIDKRLVVISNNQALAALAGSVGIPVAKNLQSRPEIAEVPALDVDDGDDVIDGTKLTKTVEPKDIDSSSDDKIDKPSPAEDAKPLDSKADKAQKDLKVPNFNTLRKKLFIGLGVGALLTGFLVWAIFYAPKANIIITARTSSVALNSSVVLGDKLDTDLKAGTIRSETKTMKKDISVAVTATGEKNVGEKATGTIKFSQQSLGSSTTVPSGTELTSSTGLVFVTTASVTVPPSTIGPGCFPTACPGTATGNVTASDSGVKFNGATGSLDGSGISVSFTGPTSGGTDKIAKVVQQSDVDKVSGDILKSGESDTAKNDLKKQFDSGYVLIDSTFKADTTGIKPVPAVGEEAPDGKASLKGTANFSIVAVAKTELTKYLDAYFTQQIDGKSNQKVYSNGLNELTFTSVSRKGDNNTATISANGKIGPKIDDEGLKEFAKGKNLGEIQSRIEEINGVDSVDVKFSPFWVRSAPNDTKRITVEFKVNDSK